MKFKVTTCYSHILYIMCAGPLFSDAVESLHILKHPAFEHEGIAGYIETEVEIFVKDLTKFASLWQSYYSLSDKRRLDLYGLAKGLGDCK